MIQPCLHSPVVSSRHVWHQSPRFAVVGWAFCAVGFMVLGGVAGKSGGENRTGFASTLVSVASYMAAAVCAGITVISFLGCWFDYDLAELVPTGFDKEKHMLRLNQEDEPLERQFANPLSAGAHTSGMRHGQLSENTDNGKAKGLPEMSKRLRHR